MASKTEKKEIPLDQQYLAPFQSSILEKLKEFGPMTRDQLCEEFGFKKHKVMYTYEYLLREKGLLYQEVREYYDKRTTIYDNLKKLEKRKLVERFSRSNGKRGRPPIYWKTKESKKPIKIINKPKPKIKKQSCGEKAVSGNIDRNSLSEKLRTETVSNPPNKLSDHDGNREGSLTNEMRPEDAGIPNQDPSRLIKPQGDFDNENYVKVPIEKTDKNGNPIRKFKTYKIIKRLE